MHLFAVLRGLDLSALLIVIWVSLGTLVVWLPRRDGDRLTGPDADAYNALRRL